MASHARRGGGTQPPDFDFDEAALAELVEGDSGDVDAGRFDGVSYADITRDEWTVDPRATIDGCRFTGMNVGSWALRGVRILETVIASADVPAVSAAGAAFRDVEVRDSRFGSVEGYDVAWRGVRFTRCKLGYVNLRGAELLDVAFIDCTIDELDLLGTTARRVAFASSRIGALNVTDATLADVDLREAEVREVIGMAGLRGATISLEQLQLMASSLADLAGIRVDE